MKILVLLKMVPDVVEELEVAPDGKGLDLEFLRMILSEPDDHALEEALILKERYGGSVTVAALDAPDVDDVLYTALAKGADRAVKVADIEPGTTTRTAAAALAGVLRESTGLLPADLILTGSQAIDDLDGLVAPLLAHSQGLPYVGIVTQVRADEAARTATVIKEYPGGVRGEFETPLPVVLGIQSAEKPPRYVPVAKVRAAMKSQPIETAAALTAADAGGPLAEVMAMSKPVVTGAAEMIEGSPEDIAGRLCGIFAEKGVL
jgi:electron transfer flavoprotein beta subunit